MNEIKLPVISKIEPDTVADSAGLCTSDLVLEINRVRLNSKTNREIGELIRSAQVIDLVVARKRKKYKLDNKKNEDSIYDSIRQVNFLSFLMYYS